MRLNNLLFRQANNDSAAIKYSDKILSYADWNTQSLKAAQKIKNEALDNSLNVAVFLPNSINYAVAYFAVQFSDKILVPIGVQAKELEIISTLKYCEIDLIISDSEHLEYLKGILKGYGYRVDVYVIDLDEIILLHENKNMIPKTHYIQQNGSEDDIAIMLHTSGTISNPKRVMLTHSNLIHNIESNVESLGLTMNDKVLIAMPMFFGYCNTAQFLTHLYLGASMVILDSVFLPKRFFQIVEREKITNFTGVPSMLLMLLDYRYADHYDYSSLRYICFGGGKMPVEKLEQLIEKYSSAGFVHTYGQTECSPRVTALLPEYSLSKIGSVGTTIPKVEIRILNATGVVLPSKQIGEIVVQGKNTMRGYYKQPQITSQTIRDGWVYTGDLGYIDDDGFLYLTGRIKNIIISGGINIYPEEIEQILLQHECVSDACVVGEDHKLLGEVPVAKVILKQPVNSNELRNYCSGRLAGYKVPVRFEIVDDLPKTYNGKTKRY
jgi:long-chain acyl-CoA synthetase